jgi:hypothetical protein
VSVVDLVRTERSFRWLWLSQVVSELGDWFQIVAIASIFPTRGGGASVLAGLIVVRYVVATLCWPIAGIAADRFNRGRLMIASDLARAAVAVAFVLVRGPGDVVLVYGLSVALEGLSTFFEPAKGAAIPQVLPPSKLYAANALSGATWSAMLALGAVAGGWTASLVGIHAAFALNAFSFVASAVFVARARVPDLPVQTAPKDVASREELHPLRDLREGLAYLRAHPAQRSLLVLKAGALLSGGGFVLIPVFAEQLFATPGSVLGQQGVLMGWMLLGRGLGALVTPFVFQRVSGDDVRGVARGLLVAFPMATAGFALFSRAPIVGIAAAALFVAHGATSTIWVGSAQLLQVTVPNRVLGRVLAVDLMLVTIAVAVVNAVIAVGLARGLAPRTVALGLAGSFALPGLLWAVAYRRYLPALAAAAAAVKDAPR